MIGQIALITILTEDIIRLAGFYQSDMGFELQQGVDLVYANILRMRKIPSSLLRQSGWEYLNCWLI
ncbi:MAG: hypothetical protein A2030_06870 [Chloroflexi bacterium RBG_19FT_COMBO_50_10]|nr:MAG: hypothetical protein A2Y53_06870 [Chloroflexi bacterium RBG_16_47_49]OGO66118.1 MAG: hypothetical protein A2030_06870 [Chloroflexi bacterium RBG_19FT_COMBO_50_10]